MTNTLFDAIERTNTGPAEYGESQFDYVNISNREYLIDAREIAEKWFSEYTNLNPNAAADLRKRFRSSANQHHFAALTELYLHQLLISNRFEPQAHPELPNVTTRPEFLASRDGEPVLVAEAVLVYNDKVSERVDKFLANIYAAIDAVDSKDFTITVTVKSRDANTQPKTSSITRFLQGRISALDYATVCREAEDSDSLPEWPYTQGRWQIVFTAKPAKGTRNHRTAKSRNLGVISQGAKRVSLDSAMRDNILIKSKKYGKFGIPFIIAVGVIRDSILCRDDIIMDALCGKEVHDCTFSGDELIAVESRRTMDGAWTNPRTGKARNAHVSGLLFLPGLNMGTLESVRPVLWHHPEATHPLDFETLSVEQRYFDKEKGELKRYPEG